MNTLITVIVTVLMLGILVIVHEGGHYLAARAFKVGIMEFSVGMGPVLFKKKGKYNDFSIRALPIGGFVSMVGEDEESDDENAFHRKPVWQRIIITAAGAFMNLVIGVLVMSLLVMTQDVLPSNVIGAFGLRFSFTRLKRLR